MQYLFLIIVFLTGVSCNKNSPEKNGEALAVIQIKIQELIIKDMLINFDSVVDFNIKLELLKLEKEFKNFMELCLKKYQDSPEKIIRFRKSYKKKLIETKKS